MVSPLCIYLVGAVVRMYFGTTWPIIISTDVIILVSLIVGFWGTFQHGFGERISTILNLHEFHFIHFSGQPLYSFAFSHSPIIDKQMISPVFAAIIEMVENVVRDKKRLHRLVMENGTELIVEKGELAIGIIIVRKYQPFFRKKLRHLVEIIENEEKKTLSCWTGPSDQFNQNMLSYIYRIF